ncbi:putative DNA repair protein RAD2 [Trypanosoma rangeli]|uniref:Putative DNA repair protein RAD2 n=1 Tax=Trypanosoma rangeli TaxID=5698 RepID=A0A3R7RIH3_TRYRA|nr:putative DNA repair protein RAD2 [Trypanosoma rangeli]RNF03244.1 putative DNA repair protein RAD2 [Trypanosoma rangeli]|eukprot:RNF03244.1 putative DNA repair protein RAD2 [Trypanosoma rangeli]
MDSRASTSFRRPSAVTSRLRSLTLANATGTDSDRRFSIRQRLRGPRTNKNVLSSNAVYADDCGLMVSLMQKACPTFPERAGCHNSGEKCEQNETESQLYLKALLRGLDEALKRRKTNAKSQSVSKESATLRVQSGGTPRASPVAAEKGALEVWMEAQRGKHRITRSAEAFSKNRSLVIAINKGRFPSDASAPISEAVRKWENEDHHQSHPIRHNHDQQQEPRQIIEVTDDGEVDEKNCQGASTSSPKGFNEFPTLLERLKREPVQSWRLIHNLTEEPEPPVRERRHRATCRTVDSMFVERLRHKFDYVSYKEQFNLDNALAARDVCRYMVMRHEASTNGQPPLRALAGVFKRDSMRFTTRGKEAPLASNEDFLRRCVWMKRAGEIALEEERQRIIDGIQAFELRVQAASLSKEAVDKLKKDLVKVLKQWPCSYRKHHVFTRADFVEWVRKRNKLQRMAGNDQVQWQSLAESMASRAEASFIEHVLALLPQDKGVHATRRPATVQ